jgi:hypothetical protein
MNAITTFLDRIANWKTLLLLLAIYMSFPAYWLNNAEAALNQLAGKTMGPIDLTIGFNPTRPLHMVADYGPEARAYYTRLELTLDVIYPLVYSLLFAVCLTLIYRNKPYRPFSWVTLVPFLCLLFDYLENAAIVTLLTTYPAQSYALAILCETAKLAKWLTFGLTMALIVFGLVKRVWVRSGNVA